MRGVQADDVFSETKDSLRFLVVGHYGAEVGHGFAVFFGVGDSCEGIGAAVILGDGDDVVPFWQVGVFAHIFGNKEV